MHQLACIFDFSGPQFGAPNRPSAFSRRNDSGFKSALLKPRHKKSCAGSSEENHGTAPALFGWDNERACGPDCLAQTLRLTVNAPAKPATTSISEPGSGIVSWKPFKRLAAWVSDT